MTQRLYYTEPYRRAFDAVIAAVGSEGGRTLVRLDRTAFYPTSGGQPFDTGVLHVRAGGSEGSGRDLRVVEVFEDAAGDVVHVVEGEASAAPPGDAVSGTVDWDRRFDHMQQHTGQHLLSAAFDRLFGVRTISFHLGAERCTIDLAREATAREIDAAESEANRVVWEDRPVAVRFVSPEEAAAMPLRKEPSRQGTLRVVEIEDFDLSACGGTHVARTGAVGVVAVAAWERFKGGHRLEFVCGGRALGRFRSQRDHLAAAARRLSAVPADLAASVDRLQQEVRDAKRTQAAMRVELARFRAAALLAAAEPLAAGAAVFQVVEGEVAWLKLLAGEVAAHPGTVAVLVSSAMPCEVVVAAARDAGVAADRVVAALVERFGGRGGGRADMAQAGGLASPPETVVTLARNVIVTGASA